MKPKELTICFLVSFSGLAVLCGDPAAGAAPKTDPPAWARYEDPEHLFSFRYPADWTSKLTFGSTRQAWFAGANGGCRVQVSLNPEDASLSSQEAVEQYFSGLSASEVERSFPGAVLISSQSGTLAGLPSRVVEVEYPTSIPGANTRIHQLSAWAFRSGVAYLVTCSSSKQAFADLQETFRDLLASFELPTLVLPELLRVAPQVTPDRPVPVPHPPRQSEPAAAAGAALFLFIYPLLAFLYGWLAIRRGRNRWAWALIGPFFFPISLILLARKARLCPACGEAHRGACEASSVEAAASRHPTSS